MDLDDKMGIDHVVYVRKDGSVVDAINVYEPEIYCDYSGPFEEAQILDEHERAMIEYAERQGWTLQTGWSHQNSGRYNGPIMHQSEYIGGRLAEHIRETPGLWVALGVDISPEEEDSESQPVGWVLAYRAAVHYGESRTACGELSPEECEDSEVTTDIKNVTCPECWEIIHRPV